MRAFKICCAARCRARGERRLRGTLLALEWTLDLVELPGEEKASVPLVLAPGRRAIDLVHRELRK